MREGERELIAEVARLRAELEEVRDVTARTIEEYRAEAHDVATRHRSALSDAHVEADRLRAELTEARTIARHEMAEADEQRARAEKAEAALAEEQSKVALLRAETDESLQETQCAWKAADARIAEAERDAAEARKMAESPCESCAGLRARAEKAEETLNDAHRLCDMAQKSAAIRIDKLQAALDDARFTAREAVAALAGMVRREDVRDAVFAALKEGWDGALATIAEQGPVLDFADLHAKVRDRREEALRGFRDLTMDAGTGETKGKRDV